MLVSLYRRLISEKVRQIVYELFLGKLLIIARNPLTWIKCKWYGIYYLIVTPITEKAQALKAWGKTGDCLSPYPYDWIKEYDHRAIVVNFDTKKSLPYVFHHGKRLYFGCDMIDNIPEIYNNLLIEQDERSAHRYVHSYDELKGKTLLDVGAAEAIFALDVIDFVDHVYLFECEDRWGEALNATFAPWKDKVTIVRKYVSDINDENNITLDAYFADKINDNFFVKMDIEGYERNALKGAKNLLEKSKNISGAICVYHLHDDKEIIQERLDRLNFSTEIQPGFLVFEGEFRSAVLRFK